MTDWAKYCDSSEEEIQANFDDIEIISEEASIKFGDSPSNSETSDFVPGAAIPLDELLSREDAPKSKIDKSKKNRPKNVSNKKEKNKKKKEAMNSNYSNHKIVFVNCRMHPQFGLNFTCLLQLEQRGKNTEIPFQCIKDYKCITDYASLINKQFAKVKIDGTNLNLLDKLTCIFLKQNGYLTLSLKNCRDLHKFLVDNNFQDLNSYYALNGSYPDEYNFLEKSPYRETILKIYPCRDNLLKNLF